MPDADWSFQVQARHNVHLAGRDPNRSQFKPGTRTIILQFSDTTGEQASTSSLLAESSPGGSAHACMAMMIGPACLLSAGVCR